MLDVSTPSLARDPAQVTAVVTRAENADLEVRVWPPEQIWAVGADLRDAGHEWEAALADESGLPSSLVLRRSAGFSDGDLSEVVVGLDRPGLAILGYLGADELGACARVPGPQPIDRDDVVFVELRQQRRGRRWQLNAFGAATALTRLCAAAAEISVGASVRPHDEGSAVLWLPGREGIVQDLVERLDRAGLDGHLRVLRTRQP